jgi:outer membrane immunogenic protein
MPVKAPAPAPAAVYNWTGWYAGVNAGASFGNVKTDFNAASVEVTSVVPSGFSDTPGFAGSDRTYPSGFIGGGQIGYNWQYSPLIVVGLEADFQGAVERDHNTITNSFTASFTPIITVEALVNAPAAPTTVSGSTVLDYQTKIDWFGTVRARLGYVWGNGDVLSYLTGGLAYGRVGINGTSTVSGAVSVATGGSFFNSQSFDNSHVNIGWVVGYGTEGRLAGMPGWMPCPPPTAGASGGGVTTHSHFTDGILRGGLNYRFC